MPSACRASALSSLTASPMPRAPATALGLSSLDCAQPPQRPLQCAGRSLRFGSQLGERPKGLHGPKQPQQRRCRNQPKLCDITARGYLPGPAVCRQQMRHPRRPPDGVLPQRTPSQQPLPGAPCSLPLWLHRQELSQDAAPQGLCGQRMRLRQREMRAPHRAAALQDLRTLRVPGSRPHPSKGSSSRA